jgi:hypothetical protein
MATKKKSRKTKSRGQPPLAGADPPIMVGGGGSAFIFMAKDLDPQLVEPSAVPGGAPQPPDPNQYYCFRVNGNIGNLVLDEGNGGPPSGHPANGKKFFVKFST